MPWLGDRFRDRFSAEGFDRHLFPAGMQRRFDDHARLGAAGYKAKVKHSAQPGGSKAVQRDGTYLVYSEAVQTQALTLRDVSPVPPMAELSPAAGAGSGGKQKAKAALIRAELGL